MQEKGETVMYCEKCGNQLPDDSLFCDKCGAKVGESIKKRMPEREIERNMAEQAENAAGHLENAAGPRINTDSQKEYMNLPAGITQDENGNFRWTYRLDMIKVPVLRNILMKIMFFSCLGVSALLGIINLIQGEDLDVVLTGVGIFCIVGVVLCLITFIVYYIVISIHGRFYTVDHLMNEEGVEHIQSPEETAQSEKMEKLVFVLELLNPDPATVGLSMAGQEHLISKYKDVKKIVAARKYHLIKVNNDLQHNHIYATPKQYEFVWNYIVTHCPNAKIKG